MVVSASVFSQDKKFTETEIAVNPIINGTLYLPENPSAKTKLIIMISGSGPTNRSGNQIGGITNCSKFLAQELAKKDIAVFTYDKRMFALMKAGNIDEKTLRFDDGIIDTKEVVHFFKSQKKYAKIIVAGHSEGSTVGMISSQKNVDGFISIAGPGRSADEILSTQLEAQIPTMKKEFDDYLSKLKNGETFELKNKMLASIFRESVQPYMISWFKYDPQDEIKKLNIPVLIINGTKDLQVPVSEAELLKSAKPNAQLVIVDNMNHVLKNILGDDTENAASYNNGELPVSNALVDAVNQFTKSI